MKFNPMAVAVDHHNGFKPPFARTPRRSKRRSFTQLDTSVFETLDPTVLANSLKQAVVAAANIHRSFSTPCLSISNQVDDDIDNNNTDTGPRIELVAGRGAPGIRALVVEAAIAMASGVDPIPAQSGLGGAYYLSSRNGDRIAVAKPMDEEPLAMNSPKGYAVRILVPPELKNSVRVGETGVREVAAYLLDHNGFAGVPPTALVKISHVAFHMDNSTAPTAKTCKIASLQRFVDHDFDAGDLGPSGFSVSSVHRIGILDVRLLNLDRHAGNILVKKNKLENDGYSENYTVGSSDLVPIDHGLCLPELLDDPYFEWLHWPQASVPFSESEAEYISRLDPFKDAELLRIELPTLKESSIRILVLCTVFLKFAAVAEVCLADIGDMMTREFRGSEQEPSVLETLCIKAKDNMNTIYDTRSDEIDEKNEEETEMFQFDLEVEDSYKIEVLDLPRLLRSDPETGKPPKVPLKLPSARSMSGFPRTILSPLHEESNKKNDDNGEEQDENVNEDEDEMPKIGGGLIKSMSFSVSKQKYESEGISFKGMSEEEFTLFLESFEKLLPKAFVEMKNMGFRQRLGTSCTF
ncbi:Phosphatidylinositol 3-/4-kinase [Macleaya cordata]|uniref:1-phosphatidylinositol 4-kinase n=1 Tax=Macleaya cordata TaxID=56857 RepID=A0A200RD70_MACCD|nr:Phosphatidylinositol 3-/4-kinase [Macleaya cordata]